MKKWLLFVAAMWEEMLHEESRANKKFAKRLNKSIFKYKKMNHWKRPPMKRTTFHSPSKPLCDDLPHEKPHEDLT